MIEPKFKVGDLIMTKEGVIERPRQVIKVCDDHYIINDGDNNNTSIIPFNLQDNWKVVEEDLCDAAENFVFNIIESNQSDSDRFDSFVAGAKWEEWKMVGNAIEAEVTLGVSTKGTAADFFVFPSPPNIKDGDKVKIIIIKDE